MLLSPVTSTPFSVDHILRLEREPNEADAKTRSQWEFHKNLEKPHYLTMDPKSGGSEGGDRAQAGSDPLRCPWETVVDAESGEYALKSFLQALLKE